MTEAEYLSACLPGPLIAHLRRVARLPPAAKSRKWRLLAAGMVRAARHRDPDGRLTELLAAVERLAAFGGRVADLPATDLPESVPVPADQTLVGEWWLARAAVALRHVEAYTSAYEAGGLADGWASGKPSAMSAAVVRCVFGNPFRPVAFDPAWQSADAVAIAQIAYDARDFGRLPVLADALEVAGCVAADVLVHLRGLGPHVRGCWALDLVLGLG